MRAIGTEQISEDERIVITFEGRSVEARRGETIAAAISAAGELRLRETRSGAKRGLFCGMGVCQECRVRVDGEDGLRACMVRIDRAMTVTRQPPLAAAIAEASRPAIPLTPEVLVVGAGAAGLAAATAAARAGAQVLIADERPAPGGQFYKQLAASPDLAPDRFADRQMQQGRDRILRASEAGAKLLSGAEVVAAFQPMRLVVRTADGMRIVQPKRLIVATGAYERGIAVPGWTLPGVMTTGTLQTLLRSYRVLPGKRILFAGNGPLNLQVAIEAAAAGAEVVAVAEVARVGLPGSIAALRQMLFASPGLALKGGGLRAALLLRNIPYVSGTRLGHIESSGDGLRAALIDRAGECVAELDADIVTMGYGFQPSNEVLRLLGCRFEADEGIEWLAPIRDQYGMTTVPGVYAVGDCARFGGAHAAGIEGEIAGLAAAHSLGRVAPEPAALRRRLARHRRFQQGLWRYYAAPQIARAHPPPDTIICRCEEVTRGELAKAGDDGAAAIGNLKRATRAGMGACQGRYCGAAGRAMLTGYAKRPGEEAYWASRPPAKPVAIAELIAALEGQEV